MDGKKLLNPLLDYFIEQELGSCKDLGVLYDVCLPRLDNIDGKIIIYGTGGNIDNNYVMGIDPYLNDDSSPFKCFIYKGDNIVEYFKSNKDDK